MDYIDKSFEGESVRLDGNTFRNCTFRDVTFIYGGGELVMVNCNMDRFRWSFEGDLARGLFSLYQLFGTDRMVKIIRGFTDPAGQDEIEF
jgi:hypothetical protein